MFVPENEQGVVARFFMFGEGKWHSNSHYTNWAKEIVAFAVGIVLDA